MRKFTLLAVFAHPDDEMVVGPLLAKYAHEGHAVHLLTLTAGERGTREHAGIPGGEALAEVRAKELACSAAELGISGHTLLHFPDQGFAGGYKNPIWKEAAAAVREEIERLRADVLITWGPEGGTGHPDHRGTSSVVAQVFQQRGLLQHKPRKVYYAVFAENPAPEAEEWVPDTRVSREFLTTTVDCTAYLEATQRAIACYRSQWTPEVMQKIRRMTERGRGHIELRLAYPAGEVPSVPEADIFAGLA